MSSQLTNVLAATTQYGRVPDPNLDRLAFFIIALALFIGLVLGGR